MKTPPGQVPVAVAGRRLPKYCLGAALAGLLLVTAGPRSVSLAAVQYGQQVDGRSVILVVPDRQSGAIPLLVALHGCDQTATEFLASTGLAELVDDENVALALPEAEVNGDNPLGCWRWWDPDNQRRDGPDARFILAVIRSMVVRIDPRRIYALGLSSGGAMAAIFGTVYPDVFAAVGIHSGVGFAAAANTACALKVMRRGARRPEERGRLAYLHQTVRRVVPAMIIHGNRDRVVNPDNADALVREFAQKNDLLDDKTDNDSFDGDSDATINGTGPCNAQGASCYAYRVARFEDRDGRTVLEYAQLDGLGHAWSGGRAGHDYADPRGRDAGVLFWRFFQSHRLEPGPPPATKRAGCRDWWAPPWWHYIWAGTMSFSEYACDMNPWSMVWRHVVDGVPGPGRCP